MRMASLRPRETRAETQERSQLGHYTGPEVFHGFPLPFPAKAGIIDYNEQTPVLGGKDDDA